MSTDTRTDEELLDAAHKGDEIALAVLVERHRDRLERMVRLRMDWRLQGRVDPADVAQDAHLAIRGKFPQYSADPRSPFFLWLRLEVGQKLVDIHRFHLGTKMREGGIRGGKSGGVAGCRSSLLSEASGSGEHLDQRPPAFRRQELGRGCHRQVVGAGGGCRRRVNHRCPSGAAAGRG